MVKIKTKTLQEMVAVASKGVGNNKLLPLTEMTCLTVRGAELEIITTDMVNYVYVDGTVEEGQDDFYVVVKADQLFKLVSKLTCEVVEMEIIQNSLRVHGNGIYMIDIPLDEEGNAIKFPDTDMLYSEDEAKQVSKSSVDLILNTARPALATTLEIPCYTGYYIGDSVIATDTYKICGIENNLLGDKVLVSAPLMDLVGLISSETISVVQQENKIGFISADKKCRVFGEVMSGVDEYQVDAIMPLLTEDFPSKCKVNKNELLSVLDRIALFVGPYDNNAIKLIFDNEGIEIESKHTSGAEYIGYLESEGHADYTTLIDVRVLLDQIKAYAGDVLNIQYGGQNSIKFTDGTVTQITALLENE